MRVSRFGSAAQARNARNREVHGARKELASLEEEIAASEKRLEAIATELADPATYKKEGRAEELGREQKKLSRELPGLMSRWEELTSTLSEARD